MPDAHAQPRPEFQFATLEQQHEVARLGMWLFLATEVLFFGGLFMAYIAYRYWFPEGFAAAGEHTKIVLGTINTAVLLTSSTAMALAVHSAEAGRQRALVLWLAATAALGLLFLGIKGFEYYQEYDEHLVPGVNFAFDPKHAGPAELFYILYFSMTGVHALHLTAGIALVSLLAVRAARGRYSPEHYSPVEVTGLYWHFVDMVWVVLFALIYLVGRNQ